MCTASLLISAIIISREAAEVYLYEWINEWCIYIALYCVLLYTQSALQSCVYLGGSLLNHHQCAAWIIRWLPQDNGAGALTTHQLKVERRESHRVNQVDDWLQTQWTQYRHPNENSAYDSSFPREDKEQLSKIYLAKCHVCSCNSQRSGRSLTKCLEHNHS